MTKIVTEEKLGNTLKYDASAEKLDVNVDSNTIAVNSNGELYKIPKQPIVFSATEFVWGLTANATFPSILSPINIEVNVGGGYDEQSGIFTAPKSGIYSFSAYIARNTIVAEDENGNSLPNNSDVRREDMIFNLMKYSASETPTPDRSTGHRFGEIWLGQVNTPVAQTWQRGSSSTTSITHLEQGEKVTLEFGAWDSANNGYSTELSYSLSGYMLQ